MKEEIVATIIEWIDKHLEEELSIETVAAKSGYSKWHLQRAFKRLRGETLASFIRRRKLDLAAKSLICSSRSIMDISMDLGFSSQQCFQRMFKRHFHETPRVYRVRHRPVV